MKEIPSIIQKLSGGLIVSCQASPGEPFFGAQFMVEFARSAFVGGAVGIRANGTEDIQAIVRSIPLPVIGLFKINVPGYSVRITPHLEAAIQVAKAGAQIIALDATNRNRPGDLSAYTFINKVQEETKLSVMADISTLEEGLTAQDAGAAIVSTTLSGYTNYSPQLKGPDLNLVKQLCKRLTIPVVAEGRISSPAEVKKAFELGAFAVVIGSAITRPQWITSRFIQGIHSKKESML